MAKRKRTKGQTTIYKNTHKTKDQVKRTPGAPEEYAVPVPLVALI